MNKNIVDLAGAIAGVLAASLWLGGLLALGAFVAPIVFHVVPAPASGDAMTLVFARFDRAALGCAAVVGVAEAIRARSSGVARIDVVRIICAVIATACAFIIAVKISPAIAELHAEGAVRGIGPLGEALDRTHDWATRLGKVESLALAVLISLHVASRRAGKSQPERTD